MGFSTRSAHADDTNALTLALRRVRASAEPWFDLTVSNPTTAQIPYDAAAILDPLAAPASLVYAPESLGLAAARAHVASDYATRGIPITAERIALTASTSEAYAMLFKVLCDPGDEVLVPTPSYPLLTWLADYESVRLVTYPLVYAGGWHVDVNALAAAVTPRTRAIVTVNPNNPTGSYLGASELEAMLDLGLPIVSDEVFARYPLGPGVPQGRCESVLGGGRGLVFALSGLSKLAGLPQLKLGWIAVGGDPARCAEAMARLELVLDAYLSVASPVQHALGSLLVAGRSIASAISARTRSNLAFLRERMAAVDLATVLDVEGGWYATVRVPEMRSEEGWALDLLEVEKVLVHPGYFFDMARGAHLVVSLLTPEADFREGTDRVARFLDRATGAALQS